MVIFNMHSQFDACDLLYYIDIGILHLYNSYQRVHNHCIADIPMFLRGGTSVDEGCECRCFRGLSCSMGPGMLLLPFARCPGAAEWWADRW